MSGQSMADVLHIHTRRTGIRSMAIHCECGWSESILGMRSSKGAFATHQAAALSAAGFGPAQEAKADAWDEGFQAGRDTYRKFNDGGTYDSEARNPYRKDQP